jgi:signal transduction histidine kinase
LSEAFDDAARSDNPSTSLAMLVQKCVAQTSASRGDLYLIDLSKSRLALAFSTNPDAVHDEAISLKPSKLHKTSGPFATVFRTKRSILLPGNGRDAGAELVVPIVREKACLGVIRLAAAAGALNEASVSAVELAAELAAFLIETKYTHQLLTVIEKRFDYRQPRDGFLDELVLLAVDASGFPYVVLRELNEDETSLDCVRWYGYSNVSAADLHLSPLSNYALFDAAISTRTTQILAGDVMASSTVVSELAEKEELQRVIIVPIVVGDVVYGAVSFAAACEHDITGLERRGLEAIANCIGSAMASYRNVGLAHEIFFERAKAAAAFTTVDVAQAARHEARNFIHNAQTNLVTLLKVVGKTASKGKIDAHSLVDDVFNDLNRVDLALDKIKAITKPVDHVRELYAIENLWHEAMELVGGRLRAMNIRYAIRGSARVQCVPDLLRHGFLQLVLNSIDAFKESGNKRGHAITITIEANDQFVAMKYTDNGIGVDVTKLMGKDFQGTPRVTDIFLPGVTTKPAGSGYGLYLVRRALDAHRGSIDLLDHRNGMSFKISIATTTE